MRVFDVWDEMMALERRMDDLFRGFVGPRARLTFPELPSGLRRPFVPACDVFRKDGELVVRAEMPSIDPEKDISVTVEEGHLAIRGERKRHEEIKEEDYYRMEASYGAFERYLPLPEGVTEKDIVAEYHDGVLEVHVPVPETKVVAPPKAKTIPVKAAKAPRKAKAAGRTKAA